MEKLPPKVIFKGVCQLRIEVPGRMQVSVYKKSWMDKEDLFFPFIIFGVFNGGHDIFQNGRRSGLMVSALVPGASGPGSSPG